MIVIIDYGMGNLRSIYKSLKRLEIESIISSDPDIIESAEKLILPGVGHFAHGMQNLIKTGLTDVLNKKVLKQKTPILGICLGMQLFCSRSEEGNAPGLNWIDAETVRFNIADTIKYKIPHIGWNSIRVEKNTKLLNTIGVEDLFYFVHSYHVKCNDQSIIRGATNYSYDFTSVVEYNNIYGTQFHPEKSHKQGLQILKNFVHKG